MASCNNYIQMDNCLVLVPVSYNIELQCRINSAANVVDATDTSLLEAPRFYLFLLYNGYTFVRSTTYYINK